MTNSDNTCLNASSNSSSPFHSFESELDPIMIAAHKQTANSKYIRWRYCSDEPVEPVEPPQSNSSHELNLIALGRTGDGKSSLLNDLIGKQVFKQKISAKVSVLFILLECQVCYLITIEIVANKRYTNKSGFLGSTSSLYA